MHYNQQPVTDFSAFVHHATSESRAFLQTLPTLPLCQPTLHRVHRCGRHMRQVSGPLLFIVHAFAVPPAVLLDQACSSWIKWHTCHCTLHSSVAYCSSAIRFYCKICACAGSSRAGCPPTAGAQSTESHPEPDPQPQAQDPLQQQPTGVFCMKVSILVISNTMIDAVAIDVIHH